MSVASRRAYDRTPMAAQTKVCPRCQKTFSLYSERCPHCGKDSNVGTQAMGLFVTLGLLMLAPIAIMLLIFLFYR